MTANGLILGTTSSTPPASRTPAVLHWPLRRPRARSLGGPQLMPGPLGIYAWLLSQKNIKASIWYGGRLLSFCQLRAVHPKQPAVDWRMDLSGDGSHRAGYRRSIARLTTVWGLQASPAAREGPGQLHQAEHIPQGKHQPEPCSQWRQLQGCHGSARSCVDLRAAKGSQSCKRQ